MKKIFLLLILAAIIWWWYQSQLTPPPSDSEASPSPSSNLETINYKNRNYRFSYFEVDDINRLKLIANTDFESTRTLLDKNQCNRLINGGFYDENNRPLGWLVAEGEEISKEIDSRLFDGFLILDDSVSISFDRSETLPRAGLQSGPMLIFEDEPLTLDIANDEQRRRMAALISGEQLIFLTVVGQDSEISGPYLEDLPGLVEAVAGKMNWQLGEAINLDGGTASAFYTDKVYLKELNPVGSIFCYN